MAELMHFQPGKTFYDAYQGARGNTLAQMAFNSQGEERQSALGKLAGLNPDAAYKLKADFDDQDRADLAEFTNVFMNLPEDLKPPAYSKGVQRFGHKFRAMGIEPPTDYKQAMPLFEQIAAASGGVQQTPAKVQEAEYAAKAQGLVPGSAEYKGFIRQYFGGDSKGPKMSLSGNDTPYDAENFRYYDYKTGRWISISPDDVGTQGQPSPTPTPTAGSVPPPTASGGKTIVTPQDIQGAAQRTGAVMQQVRAEIAQLVAQGVPADQATSQVTQKYAQGRGLTMPTVGQQPAPVQQTAPPVTQTAPPPMATGGQGRNPFAKEGSRPATAQEKAVYGIPADVPAEMKPDGSINVINLPKNDQSASIANETTIRKEFAAQVKPYQDVISAYKRVESAASSPTAAGDLSMIFAYMKMLDPGSVVREGEFANAQNAAGVPDQVVNMYNRIRTGQRLNPSQRADFLAQAGKLKMNAESSYKQYERQYRSIAEQYKIPPERILVGPSVTTQDGELDFNSPDPLGMFK